MLALFTVSSNAILDLSRKKNSVSDTFISSLFTDKSQSKGQNFFSSDKALNLTHAVVLLDWFANITEKSPQNYFF